MGVSIQHSREFTQCVPHSQIHQMQLPHFDVLFVVFAPFAAFHSDGEDGVRSRRMLIHVCHTDLP